MNTAIDPDGEARGTGRMLLVDSMLALAIAVVTFGPLLLRYNVTVIDPEGAVFGMAAPGPSRWWVVAVAAAICAPLAVRRVWPWPSFVGLLVLNVVAVVPATVEATEGASANLFGASLPLLVVVFTVANLVPRRMAVLTGVVASAGVAASTYAPYVFSNGIVGFFWYDLFNSIPYSVTPVVLVVIVAQILREQRLRADAAQREVAMAMVSAELRAASAASAERRRLASELHDIVAHHVNLMVVQAEKGPFVHDAEGTSRTYATIAETGRSALGELDRLLGVLRTDGTGSPGAPQMAPLPTIDEIPSLVDAANRAGVGVLLRTFEPPPVVEPAVAATVHRIVQECITNVVKHADHGEAAVLTVTHAGTIITVRMENRSAGSERGARRGHGLDSMCSRLEVFGGSLSVDDRDGVFRVEAIVPFTMPTRQGVDRTAVTA